MGRKRKVNKKEVLEALKKTLGVVTPACESAGISRTTFYKWYKQDRRFKDKVDEMEEIVLDFVESKLYTLINKGNPQATMFFLECKGKIRQYIRKLEQETTIKHEEKASESDKEMLELFEQLKGEKEKAGHGPAAKKGDKGSLRPAVPQLIPVGDPGDLEL